MALACAALLAACATTSRTAGPLDAAQQRDLLLHQERFSFTGSVGVAPQGVTASVDWQQQQAHSKMKLSGPLGAGSLQLDYSPASLRIATGRGEQVADMEAEQLLVQELGFVPPFDALHYWVLGVPAPGAVISAHHDDAGLLLQLEQQGWLITYERRVAVAMQAGTLQLPAKLRATRGEQRLTLVIYRWRLK